MKQNCVKMYQNVLKCIKNILKCTKMYQKCIKMYKKSLSDLFYRFRAFRLFLYRFKLVVVRLRGGVRVAVQR